MNIVLNELRKVRYALNTLRFILNREQKKYCILMFAMSLLAAAIETVGVSAIVPLIYMVLSMDQLMNNHYILVFRRLLHIDTSQELVIWMCVLVGFIYLLRALYMVFYTWCSAKFSNKIRRELAVRVLDAYMKQGYIFFVEHNTSRLIQGFSADVGSVQAVIDNMFQAMAKILTILFIIVFIVVRSPLIALGMVLLVLLSFVGTQAIFRRPVQRYGIDSREIGMQANQASVQAVQGSKEILVFGRQQYFVDEYFRTMAAYNRVNVKMTVANAIPGYMIELVCVIGVMAVLAIESSMAGNLEVMLVQLATIAIAAFRILPGLGVLITNVNTIVFNAPGLNSAHETIRMVREIEEEKNGKADASADDQYEEKHFERELLLSHISYTYPGKKKKVIDDLTMSVKKGQSIGIIGTSGAGKTTMSDLLLGLLKPQSGKVLMDGINIEDLGREWHYIIGYVPQAIYMTDDSVRRNVAFGIDDALIDDNKVWKALEMAQLLEFIKKQPDGLDSHVGERGVQISGGQRQRIAIARALYNDPDIIVLDEATAALDNETETAVMESIEALQSVKTLIIVAHRLSTIRNCDVIYEVENGKAIIRTKAELGL